MKPAQWVRAFRLRAPARKPVARTRASASRRVVQAPWKRYLQGGLRLLGAGAALALVLGALVWVAPVVRDGIDQPIRQVRILSDLYYQDPEDIRLVIARHRLDRFSRVPLAQIRGGIEALEWIQQAHVRRVWPESLEVRIREQIPVARWGDAELLNERGEQFRVGDATPFAKLPLFRGPAGTTGRVLEMHQRIAPLLQAHGLRMEELQLSARGAWDLQLEGGVLVRLGRSDVLDRFGRFLALYERELAERFGTVAVIDTRYSTGIAVTWAKGQVVESEASS